MVAGLYGAFAVMVALRQVEVEGRRRAESSTCPLIDPLFLDFIATEAPIYNLTEAIDARVLRQAGRSKTTSPRNVFKTKDGRYIGISASIQAMAERLFRAIGREDVIADPRFRTNTDRVRNAEECEAPIVEFIAARTLEENMAAFEAAEVTASPVYDIDRQFLRRPWHVAARGIVVDVPDAQVGQLTMHNIITRPPLRSPGRLRTPAPEIGEHTAEILGQLGVGRDELDALAREGIIGLGK